ncbi:MAG: hypothetical protein AAFY07_13105, partial [Pseudomonadota bacterium]
PSCSIARRAWSMTGSVAAVSLASSAGHVFDHIALLQPTSPLRRDGMVDRAFAQLRADGADSLLSVTESHAFFWRKHPVRAGYNYRNRPRRQDIPSSDRQFRETGSLYLTARDVLVRERNRLGGSITLFETSEEEGFEIDSLADFRLLESLMPEAVPA